jgi:hypothetical protein
MGLEFTSRPDRAGAAAYFIGDGTPQSEQNLQQIASVVDQSLPEEAQVVILDGQAAEGAEVVDFYGITSLPAVLIIMDDDQIYHAWYVQLPSSEDVLYMMGQAGVRLRGDQ